MTGFHLTAPMANGTLNPSYRPQTKFDPASVRRQTENDTRIAAAAQAPTCRIWRLNAAQTDWSIPLRSPS